ncbi:MAG: histone deacetylase family protein [Candidatus Limnocylindria bacterium]
MSSDDPGVLLLTDPATAAHAWPGHPERPDRVDAVAAGVADGARAAGARLVERSAAAATLDVVSRVHDAAYLQSLVAVAAAGGGWLDPDTYLVEATPPAAMLAAGMAVAAAEAIARGDADVAFAAVRPPGHHAHRDRGKGFCVVNNVAVATASLRVAGGASRVAILDWDVHHGDGTQAVFESDPSVFYGSTHQFPWYPGTGSAAERSDTLVNVPLPAGSGDDAFVAAWRDTILPAVERFAPAAILVSAGYDAHIDDPLAGLMVTSKGFRAVASEVGSLARKLGLRGVALTLEGGYDLDALRASTGATIEGLLAGLRPGPRRDSGE